MPKRKIKQELLSAPPGPQSSPALTRVHRPQISSLRSQDLPQAAASTTEPFLHPHLACGKIPGWAPISPSPTLAHSLLSQ